MATFTIWKVEKKKQFTTQHGTFQAYSLTLEAEDKSHIVAELVQKPETAEPVAGTEIKGTLQDGQYGKKFKKEQQQFQERTGGQSDPKKETRITHMHAQKCALSYAHLRQAQGRLPDEFGLEDLFNIAARFRADVESVTA
jgi:hypothetical protein